MGDRTTGHRTAGHWGKNVVIVLALIAAGFFVAWLRFRPYLGSEGRYTDGVQTYDVAEGSEVRYAVWDRPSRLAGEANGPEAESRPALSPDGRWLVFAVGERGLGSDLYVAEMIEGRAIDPRPLAVLNTDADELAPAFSGAALYFASDRLGTAGGLDLYRATYDRGLFGDPERLEGGINSTSEDTEPAPIPGSEALAFASNRGTGGLEHYDLYLARPIVDAEDAAADWRVESLVVLNTAFDERDPAFTPDGRTLFFASDRAGSRGGFDLFRSGLGADGWVPPEPLVGINSERSERGPIPAGDGFELYFSVEERDIEGAAAGALSADLYRARSLELFRNPGRPVGWRELLVLAALLVLALLAWLAKRWEDLEVLYKCLLISLVIHALLMWWFRDVYPEGSDIELRGRGDRIRVRLDSDSTESVAANSERGGELEVARDVSEDEPAAERSSVEVARLDGREDATAMRLERAAMGEVAAPARAGGQAPERTEAEVAEVALQAPAEAFERRSGDAPSLALDAAAAAERAPRAESGDPARGSVTSSTLAAPTPAEARVARADPALPDAPGGGAAGARPERRDASATIGIAQPTETFERHAGAVAELALEAPAAPTNGRRAAESELAAGAPPTVDIARDVDDGREAARPAQLDRASTGEVATPGRAGVQLPERTEAARTEVALQAPSEVFERRGGSAAALAVEAGSVGERASRELESNPARGGSTSESAIAEIVPSAARSTRPRVDLPDVAGGGAALEQPVRDESREVVASVGIAQPTETFERHAGGLAELEELALVPRAAAPEGPRRPTLDLARGSAPPVDVLDAVGGGAPDAAPIARGAGRDAGAGAAPPREDLPLDRPTGALELPTVSLADGGPRATAAVERLAGEASELEVGPSVASARRSTADVSLDARRFARSARAERLEVAPARTNDLQRGPIRAVPSESITRREKDEVTPAERALPTVAVATPTASPDSRGPEARSPETGSPETGSPETGRTDAGLVAELDVSELASAAGSTRADRGVGAPARMQGRRDAPRLAAFPDYRPLAAVELDDARRVAPPEVTRWEHTPYQSRAGVEKLQALELHGGSEQTEAAVALGLGYLARKQKPQGYWGGARDRHEKYRHVAIGKTGLAMLAFLGAGHTQESDSEYSEVVGRAIGFLLSIQDEATGHFGDCTSYGHAIATYALAECFALTGDERLRAPLEQSVSWIVSKQMRMRDPRFRGGWGYYYPDGHEFDPWPRASVTAWQVMALESARLGGLEVPDDVFSQARTFLRQCWDSDRGAFRYSHDPSRLSSDYEILPGSTPASLFALSLLGDDVAGESFREARTFVLERAPRRYRYTTDDDFVYRARGNLYFWYYGTLAMFRVGDVPWQRWNVAMKGALLPAQNADGSWEPISIYALDYAADTDEDRTYSTAMCVLTLEIYYRYFTPLLKVE